MESLNRLIDITVPRANAEGGTLVIPGHGRISDHADVVYYRDMVAIIRDRIQDMIKRGMTLEQVKAARPTLDYDARYGNQGGLSTTEKFIEAAYESAKSKQRSGSDQIHESLNLLCHSRHDAGAIRPSPGASFIHGRVRLLAYDLGGGCCNRDGVAQSPFVHEDRCDGKGWHDILVGAGVGFGGPVVTRAHDPHNAKAGRPYCGAGFTSSGPVSSSDADR